MMNINIDTPKLAIQLEAGGFATEQARALASSLDEAAQAADLVTNSDLKASIAVFEQRMDTRFDASEQRMDARLDACERRMDARFDAFEQKTTAAFSLQDQRLNTRLDAMDQRVNARFEINNTRFADLEQRMLIRLGGMLVVMTSILLAGIRYMH